MQFEKDIFISYAHIDDESLIASQKGWITEFHRALEIRLAQLMGRRPTIWRDPSLQGNHIFDKQIVSQFANVAILISILTPRYVKSEWCVKEVDEFYNACQENIGFNIQNISRIFKVIKTPVRIELHPEKIKNVLGYEFYSTDPTTGRIKEFGQVFGQQSELAYWEKLDDLANDICSFLETIEGITSTTGTKTSFTESNTIKKKRKKIYLAESSYDTIEFRDNIRRELLDLDYFILPDKQLPLVASILKDEVSKFLQEADIAIHLLGAGYGVVPEGTQKSIVEIQNELASAQSAAKHLPRLIWTPAYNIATDDRQQIFLDKLQSGTEGIAGADLIISSLEDFKSTMFDKLKSLEEEKQKSEETIVKNAAAEAERKIVYLICDMNDMDLIKPLEDVLFENGCEVLLPIFEGDEAEIREDHIENLKICDSAIVFYGNANELWLRSKMRDFLKINAYGRSKPLAAKIVYLAPPDNASKQRFRSLEAEVLNGINEVSVEKLKTLLA
ncbi:MAG: toll/interleukin-1 receptor domain-containing protein [Chitinophagales bacterium]|nr:toll/interleukin-1 receptor domain-containing protein [Chitinophagales bacterium]